MQFPFSFTKKYGRFDFERKYLRCSRLVQDINELSLITKDYETLVCGSDQIWAPNCYNPVYFASFANKGIRKVSYAASIGLNSIPENLIPVYKKHLSDFYAIGIREQEGSELLKHSCGIDSKVVLDPTLLVERAVYESIEKSVKMDSGKYLFIYVLNKNHHYKERIVSYAEKHNLQIVGISSNSEDKKWMHRAYEFSNLGADSFVWLIHHAEVVMTDSYHGTIFSLLFHKVFYTFLRFDENDPICQNSRIRQLDTYFNIDKRIAGPKDPLEEKEPFDYEQFECRLKTLRNYSLDFLNYALQ